MFKTISGADSKALTVLSPAELELTLRNTAFCGVSNAAQKRLLTSISQARLSAVTLHGLSTLDDARLATLLRHATALRELVVDECTHVTLGRRCVTALLPHASSLCNLRLARLPRLTAVCRGDLLRRRTPLALPALLHLEMHSCPVLDYVAIAAPRLEVSHHALPQDRFWPR